MKLRWNIQGTPTNATTVAAITTGMRRIRVKGTEILVLLLQFEERHLEPLDADDLVAGSLRALLPESASGFLLAPIASSDSQSVIPISFPVARSASPIKPWSSTSRVGKPRRCGLAENDAAVDPFLDNLPG
jgi:hypothetical protein